jgi:hypothetical protein
MRKTRRAAIALGLAAAMLVGGAVAAGAAGTGPGTCGPPGASITKGGAGISDYAKDVGPPGQIQGAPYSNPGGFVNQVCLGK